MPATYTHCCFGKDVLDLLPAELQVLIRDNRAFYDLGLHGPDVMFYYRALRKNPVSDLGYAMHRETGHAVFRRFARLLARTPSDEAKAYLCGFLCHFALDSTCHGFVEEMAALGVGHSRLETELDRACMTRDGLDPLRHDPTRHIHPSVQTARIMAQFFPEATVRQTEAAIKSMVRDLRLLLVPTRPKRLVVEGVLGLLGKDESIGGMVMRQFESQACRRMVAQLLQLYTQALPLAVTLITTFPDVSHDQYDYNFDGERMP